MNLISRKLVLPNNLVPCRHEIVFRTVSSCVCRGVKGVSRYSAHQVRDILLFAPLPNQTTPKFPPRSSRPHCLLERVLKQWKGRYRLPSLSRCLTGTAQNVRLLAICGGESTPLGKEASCTVPVYRVLREGHCHPGSTQIDNNLAGPLRLSTPC